MTTNLNNLAINSFDDFCNFLYFIDEAYFSDEDRLIQLRNFSNDKFSKDLNEVLTLAETKLNNILSDENIYLDIENKFELYYPDFIDYIGRILPSQINLNHDVCLEISAVGIRNLYNYLSCKEAKFISIESFFLMISEYLESDLFSQIIYNSYMFYDLVKKAKIDDFSYYLRYLALVPTHGYRYCLDKINNPNPNFELEEIALYYKMYLGHNDHKYKDIVFEKFNALLNEYQLYYFATFAKLINAYHELLDGFKISKINDLSNEKFIKFVDKFIADSETTSLAYDELDYHEPICFGNKYKNKLYKSSDKEIYYYSKVSQLKMLVEEYHNTNLLTFAEQYLFNEEPNVVNLEMFKDLCACLRDDMFYECSATDNLVSVVTKVIESKLKNSIIVKRNILVNQLIRNYELDIVINDFFVYLANYIVNYSDDMYLQQLKTNHSPNYKKIVNKKYNKRIKKHSPIYIEIMKNSENFSEISNLSTNLMILKPSDVRKNFKNIDLTNEEYLDKCLKEDLDFRYNIIKNNLYPNLSSAKYKTAVKSLFIFFANESDVAITSASIFDLYLSELYSRFSLI